MQTVVKGAYISYKYIPSHMCPLCVQIAPNRPLIVNMARDSGRVIIVRKTVERWGQNGQMGPVVEFWVEN